VQALFLGAAVLLLLAIIALMLWKIERRLRPETYVLMQRDDETNAIVPADAFPGEYATIEMAHAAAAELFFDDHEPVFIVSTKNRLTVDTLPAPVEPEDPNTNLLVCDRCGTEHMKRDLRWTDPEPGKLYGKRLCRNCWRADAEVQS